MAHPPPPFVGEGAFSKVYLAESKQDKGGLAAVKVINKVEIYYFFGFFHKTYM